jgi:7-cyano-7-deazaguanine tRNA-ribosyltransferase
MEMSQFEIRAKDGLARLGRFTTTHGTVKTPLLMPVVHPGKSAITPRDLIDKFGFQMVITNSYIIRSHDRFRTKAIESGVHGLLDFDGPIMTDSGTFQMYFHGLAEGEIDPLEIVEFQKSIGSDIGTILDVFSDPKVGRTKVEQDVAVSLERARLSVPEKGEMMLAGTIQGGIYEDLRESSAKEMALMDFDVHPIGGVVPLMEQYRYSEIVRVVLASKKHLPPDRPVHLFGCGHPMLFAQAALLGCDFFDSASYAKFAESGRMLFPTGTMHLDQLEELPCECPICSTTDAKELLKLDKPDRDLSLMKHNLFVSAAELRRVRQAIRDGKLFELAAARSAGHPTLLEAFSTMMRNSEQIVQSDPLGKSSSIMYAGPETLRRPEMVTFHSRVIERYPYRTTDTVLLVPHLGDRPFADTLPKAVEEVRKRSHEHLLLIFITPSGAIPWELEHVHPAQQCVFPKELGESELEIAAHRIHEVLGNLSFKQGFWLTRDTATEKLGPVLQQHYGIEQIENLERIEKSSIDGNANWGLRKLRALLAYQWMIDPSKIQDVKSLQFVTSKNTGKIRYVKRDDKILFTLVPTTGLFTPTYEGGLELINMDLDDRYRVSIKSEVSEFVAKGKSTLAKFVTQADPSLRAGEEVLVTDEDGSLLGVGRALLNGQEMMTFSRGVAVATRHSKS